MEYKYFLEEKANKHLLFEDIFNGVTNNQTTSNNNCCIMNIICYYIETNYKYPFVQFMMEKIPYCNDIIKEELIFPYIIIKNSEHNISELVLEKVQTSLNGIGIKCILDENMYKGIIFKDNLITAYALVNITEIFNTNRFPCMNFTRQTLNWFVLPSEIINCKNVLNICIDSDIINLFTDFRQISHLFNIKNNEYYMLPDVVYTIDSKKEAEFKSVFGNIKTKMFNNCSQYYFFNRSYNYLYNANANENVEERWINRYALFVEGKIYFENDKEFNLTDEMIERVYPEPCIIICYSFESENDVNMLVKNDESFASLSYHNVKQM